MRASAAWVRSGLVSAISVVPPPWPGLRLLMTVTITSGPGRPPLVEAGGVARNLGVGRLFRAGDSSRRAASRTRGRFCDRFDVLAYPRCGRAMRLIALIEQPDVVRRILRHLGEATEVPAPAPARSPPLAREDADGPTAWSEEPDAVSRGSLDSAADDPC